MFALFGGAATSVASGVGLNGAFGNGIALAVLVYVCAANSGGKLNPAVSLMLVLTQSTSVDHFLVEILAQFTGAIAGSAFLGALVPHHAAGLSACFTINTVKDAAAFGWEFLMTMLLLFTVLATAVDPLGVDKFGSVAPLAIGLYIFVGAKAAGPYTGGAANPARYLGPVLGIGGCPQSSSKWYIYMLAHFSASFAGFGYWYIGRRLNRLYRDKNNRYLFIFSHALLHHKSRSAREPHAAGRVPRLVCGASNRAAENTPLPEGEAHNRGQVAPNHREAEAVQRLGVRLCKRHWREG